MSTRLKQGQIVKIKSIPKGYRGPLKVGDSVTLEYYESNSTWTIRESKWMTIAFGFTRANFDLPKTTALSESTELFSVDADFLKQAHAAACSEWKEKLEQKYPKVFAKPLEVDVIRKAPTSSYLTNDIIATITPTIGKKEYLYIADGLAPIGLNCKCLALGCDSQFKFEIAEGGSVVILVPKA
jgi:hypothetical protein